MTPTRHPIIFLFLALLALPAACTPEFDEVWMVKDLRILAIRVEPPEVLVPEGTSSFPPVAITALVVDPLAPEGLFDWQIWACTAEEITCDDAAEKVLLREDRTRLEAIGAELRLEEPYYRAALAADPLQGFGGVPVLLELRVSREGFAARGIKRAVYGHVVPPEKTPNANPAIDRVLRDDQPLPDPWQVAPEAPQKLLPRTADGAKESYWVATYSGGKRELGEYLSYSFFTTSGKLSHATTGGRPQPFVTNKKIDDPSSEWTPAPDQERATLWIVVHDDRGGVGWVTLPAEIRP